MNMQAATNKGKTWAKWAIALAVALLLGFGVYRSLAARKTQQQALEATSAASNQGQVELAESDVVRAQMLDVVQGLPVSGSLRAVDSALIKARVAGELQGLTVREGDYIKAGQVIARIESSEYASRLRQAREQAESAKAQVEIVQRQYDNNKALVDQGFISKTALDASLANLNAAQSTYKASQAATDVARKSVDDTVLRAPINGQISQRLAQPGERVSIDARIVEIVDLSRLELEATLSAADAAAISVGQRAALQIEGGSQLVNARIVRINPSAQAGSRSVLAYLSVDNLGSGSSLPLRQGLFAQGTLGTASTRVLAVPVSSVRTDRPMPYVQAVESGRIVHKAVEPGVRGTAAGESVVAVKGLADNTVVIRASIGALREGTQVVFTKIPGADIAGAQRAAPASVVAPVSGTRAP